MRAILIILCCAGLLVGAIWKITALFASGVRGEKPTQKHAAPEVQKEESVKEAPENVPLTVQGELAPVAVELGPVYGPALPTGEMEPSSLSPAPQSGTGFMMKKASVVRVFRFVNRPVPPLDVLRAEVTAVQDFAALIDERSNAWIIRGTAEVLEEYAKVVELLDLRPEQVDLDFLLVAVSQDRIAQLGLSGLLQSGAPHLEGISLGFDSNGLDLRVGSASLSLDVEMARQAVHVVTVPVVRAMVGEPFKLDSVDEVPIAQSTYREDVETRAFEYRKIGLGISGNVQRVGATLMLKLKQSNGSVVRESEDAPTFRTSETETAAWLSPNAWTVISGLTMERRVWRRGFLERKDDQEKDLVLLFARARTAVGAVATGDFVEIEGMPALDEAEHPLLPPKPAATSSKAAIEEREQEFIREHVRRRRPIGPRHK